MLVIFRWWYFLGIAGIGLTTVGAIETKLAARAGSSPIAVSLDALERGEAPDQPYAALGEHVALFNHTVQYGRKGGIDWSCYPVIGKDHAYLKDWRTCLERYETPADIPARDVPRLKDVVVFVKSAEWKHQSVIPSDIRTIDRLEGILFRFDQLSGPEKDAVRAVAPLRDEARTFVLEAHRHPWPLWKGVAIGGLGVALILQAIRLFRRPRGVAAGAGAGTA